MESPTSRSRSTSTLTSLSAIHKQAPYNITEDDEEDLERCPRCNIHFATTFSATIDSAASAWCWPLPVPISCLACGGATLCKLCVDKVDQCTACGAASAVCFDMNVPNVAFGRALDLIRDLKAAQRRSLETNNEADNQKHTKDNQNSHVTTVTVNEEAPLKVGDRVFCIWDSDGLYYRGRIAAVYCINETGASSSSSSSLPLSGGIQSITYKIHFDDGDTRWAAPRQHILTLEEATTEDLVVTGTAFARETQVVARAPTKAGDNSKVAHPYYQANKRKRHV